MKEEVIELGGLRAISVGDRGAGVVVVLLHGFQMQATDLSPFAHSMQAPAWFLFPLAPHPADDRGRAWWHIDARLRDEALKKGPRDFAPQHPPDLSEARARLSAFLDAVQLAASARPLVLGGFSQGGMLSIDTFLRGSHSMAALVL